MASKWVSMSDHSSLSDWEDDCGMGEGSLVKVERTYVGVLSGFRSLAGKGRKGPRLKEKL